MSEKELRDYVRQSIANHESGAGARVTERLLAAKPDLVVVTELLRKHKIEPPKNKAEKFYKQGWMDAITALADNLERKFKFRLIDEPPGWEYTDDQS